MKRVLEDGFGARNDINSDGDGWRAVCLGFSRANESVQFSWNLHSNKKVELKLIIYSSKNAKVAFQSCNHHHLVVIDDDWSLNLVITSVPKTSIVTQHETK